MSLFWLLFLTHGDKTIDMERRERNQPQPLASGVATMTTTETVATINNVNSACTQEDACGIAHIIVCVNAEYNDDDPNNGYTESFRAETEEPLTALLGELVDAGMNDDGSEWWSFRIEE